MNNNCDKTKDQIAELILGVLPESQIQRLQQHISECSSCRAYAEALQKEEQLVSGLFSDFDADMTGREDSIINAVNHLGTTGQTSVISAGSALIKSSLTKCAAAAAAIIFVTVYSILTLTWIWQINECIQYCS